MGRWENLMCHTDALVYGFSKIHAIFVQYWNAQEFNWIIFCVNIFIYIIIVKRYLLCRKYFFSLLKLYGLCEELAIRLKYDGNNRKNIGSDSTWWLLPFGVIEMMMTSAWGGCASAQGWQLQQDAINVSLKGGHSQQRIFPLQFLWKEELTWSLRKYKYVSA